MKNYDVTKDELATNSVKSVAEETESREASSKRTPNMNFEKAAADAVNKLKQDLATK